MNEPIKVVQAPPVPVMHWRLFAQLVGVEEGVMRGMCEKGHVPIVQIGRHRFINLALLHSECMSTSYPD
ncbi:hypothetical protein GO613_13860 [Azoarcus communis]|uniref:hypothetical protein n=1 Tax=Parazoarcus communis TaxID=41977 RepID=UPI0014598846|nr:hypothetical protein [Parazoarcus communis]NMG49189.1 hypothetical protein [Parazoarcus communis]